MNTHIRNPTTTLHAAGYVTNRLFQIQHVRLSATQKIAGNTFETELDALLEFVSTMSRLAQRSG